MVNQVSTSLDTLRHSTAHLLAQAVKQLFPTAKVAIGPVIENGFYYDFAYERAFNPEDLIKIETRMRELVQQNLPIVRKMVSRAEAIRLFQSLGEDYKVEIIQNIPPNDKLSVYQQGDFQDLCRGPHVLSTACLKAFKLMRVAGAYWRGDSRNPMLQRIYGTAWETKKDLENYLRQLEEAEKRDHRKLATQLDLFHLQEDAPGMVFWHAKGWVIYQTLKAYIRQQLQTADYQEIQTPQLLSRRLWEQSGHWDKFFSDMFTTQSETREFAIKPMNCPGHVQIFKQRLRSYRELPLRLAEFGFCHRNEPSGALHGLLRARGFVQDDAHIFCTESQIHSEVSNFIDLLHKVYSHFGFKAITFKLATRPEKRVGSEESWDKAEAALSQALQEKGLIFEQAVGEGAFYGPKIEFSLKDCLNRVWQCGTIQVDFSMPARLGATYVDEHNNHQVPIMIHRAILGSLERFIGILLEHYAGRLPVWLAPIQLVIMTISDQQQLYAQEIAQALRAAGLRVAVDLKNEKIGFKIREHSLQKIPYQVIIGAKEQATQTVNVRQVGGTQVSDLSVIQLIQQVQAAVLSGKN
jgi:threonyl-tRNA synthetase